MKYSVNDNYERFGNRKTERYVLPTSAKEKIAEKITNKNILGTELDDVNKALVKYNNTLNENLEKNVGIAFTDSKIIRNNQQTLLNQTDSIETKSNYYDTKQKQNIFNVEKNKYRENIFRLLLGLNIILLFIILFIINKA